MSIRASAAVLAVTTLAACGGNQLPPQGTTDTELLFPFDGTRTWSYKATDDTVPYSLDAVLLDEVGKYDGQNVYTINFTKDCFQNDPSCIDGELAFSLSMSNFAPQGTFINGFDDGFGYVPLDPPIQVVKRDALLNDPVESETAGRVFSSTYEGNTSCEDHVLQRVAWDCHGVSIEADAPFFPVTGTMYAVAGQGIVAFNFDSLDMAWEWQLANSECTGECDGVW